LCHENAVKIAVCVKVVPTGRHGRSIDPASGRIVRDAGALSDLDRHAVETALKLREDGKVEVEEIVVVTAAPSASLGAVQEALAMGAERAVHIADRTLEGSDLLATSRVLSKALSEERADLVLFGPQGDDSSGAMLWAAVGARLGLPVLSHAIELEASGGRVRILRQSEAGYETLSAAPPCIVSVSSAINQPRYVSLKGRMAARTKAHDLVTVGKLGLDPSQVGELGSGTRVLGLRQPTPRGERRVIKDGPDVALEVLEFLREKKFVQ
jgi:electron transfer flavoprotein beta subunit